MYNNKTYEEHSRCNLHLRLRPEDDDQVGSCLLIGEPNRTVRLSFNVMDEDAFLAEKRAVIPSRDGNRFIDVILVLFETKSTTIAQDVRPRLPSG